MCLTSCLERPQTWSDSACKTKQADVWRASGRFGEAGRCSCAVVQWNFPEWLEWKPVAPQCTLWCVTAVPTPCQRGRNKPKNHKQFKKHNSKNSPWRFVLRRPLQTRCSRKVPLSSRLVQQLQLETDWTFWQHGFPLKALRQLKESTWPRSTNKCFPLALKKKYLCSKENWPDWENKSQIGRGGFKWCKRVGSYSGGWIRISQCMGVHSKYELLSGYHTPILWK